MLYLLYFRILGLLPYLYVGAIALLCFYIAFLTYKVITTTDKRVGRSWHLVLALVPFVYLTWPFLVGKVIFEAQCASIAGLYMPHPIDARETGFFLYSSKNTSTSGVHVSNHPYAHQAVYDLISGRISFFEGSGSYYGGKPERQYIKIFLANNNSSACADDILPDKLLRGLRLSEGKCLAEVQSDVIESRYEVRGYEGGALTDVQILDRKKSEKIAGYRIASLPINRPTFKKMETKYCPANNREDYAPIHAITAATFLDVDRKVMSEGDFSGLKQLVRTGFIQEFPPRQLNEEQQKAIPATCAYPDFGSDVEVYKVDLQQGGNPVDVKIDNSTITVREVDVVINNPTKRTLLYLSAHTPVVWKISRTPDSVVAGVVATGYYGKAVVGIDSATPLLISTRHHNPAVNCNSSDIGKLLLALRGNDTKEIKAHDAKTVVIGQSDYQANSLIFSEERGINNYRVY